MENNIVKSRTFDTVLQFRAYTTREGYRRLDELLAMHQTLYNAALQNRRDALENAAREHHLLQPVQGTDRPPP